MVIVAYVVESSEASAGEAKGDSSKLVWYPQLCKPSAG